MKAEQPVLGLPMLAVAGKLGEEEFPAMYTLPPPSIAIVRPSSVELPPRNVE